MGMLNAAALREWASMTSQRYLALAVIVLVNVCSLLAYGQELKIKGMIVSRAGEDMTLRTPDGEQVVTLTDETKAQVPSGMFRKKETSMAELIPGLSVEVTGTRDGTKLVAKSVRYTKDELKTANAIQAGMTMTQQHVAENRGAIATNKENVWSNKENIAANQQQIEQNQVAVEQRFADLTDFEVKGSTTVYFAAGKSALTSKNKAALLDLTQKAATLKGYMIEVIGYCDSTGN